MAVTSGLSLSPDINVKPVRSLWTPSWPLLMGLVAFVWLAFGVSQPMLGDPDTHWHITVGNWILQHRTVPRTDIYSYTFAGQPWIAKEWLSQVLLAGAYDIGGWGGVVVLAAAALATAFALLLRFLLRDLTPFPALLFTVAAFTLASAHFLARPHVLAFPVMVWWVAGLVRAVEERRAPKPVLLIAMLLWANLHGGFTLGFVLAGALGLDALIGARDATERRTLFVAWAKFGVATFLVACITPYGPESMLVTLRIFNLGDALSVITEWRSPNFQEQPMQELLLLLAIYLALSRGLKLPLIRLLIVIGLVHLFLKYARNAELLAMLAPLVIAPLLARQWPSLPRVLADGRFAALARPAGRRLVALCLGVTALLAIGLVRFGGVTAPEATTPLAALKFAREAGLKGHVFNHYGYGGFLIESGVPTFIDGRGELFGGDFINRYVDAAFLRGKGTPLETILDEFKIEWTFLSKDMPANKLLARLPGWRLAYSDDEATIFVRDR